MDYDNGFILQKTVVSTNRSVDWGENCNKDLKF